MNKLQTIENHFVEKNVLTLQDISDYFNVSVLTVQRIISPLDTIKSYDHNGRYFSLEKLANFDCEHRTINEAVAELKKSTTSIYHPHRWLIRLGSLSLKAAHHWQGWLHFAC